MILWVQGAGLHLSGGLSFPDNVRFIYQPAFTPRNASPMEAFLGVSPELNPAEHLWEELREKELANKAFDSLDTLEDALCEGLNQLASHPQRLRSLTDFPYFKVTPISEQTHDKRRTFRKITEFCRAIGFVVDALPDTRLGHHVGGQLVRCGTS